MRHYCSLADSRYLPQLLALNDSLARHSSEPFVLYVLPMDQAAMLTLKLLNLPDVLLVDYALFETEMKLAEARKARTWAEFCWTSASNLCEYLMRCGVPEITYLDADVWFMDDPEIALREIGQRSIGIVPHRFTDNADKPRLERSGKFNVSLVHFKNTYAGRKCLSKWAAQVRERCSADSCGDQLQLDAWPVDYGKECAIIENIAVGVAPWNLSSYRVTLTARVNGKRICMYHYHETRFLEDGTVHLTNYALRPEDIELIYSPYIAAVEKAKQRIAESLHLQTF